MMLTRWAAPLAAIALSTMAAATFASAVALPLPSPAVRTEALPVEQAHGCHRGVQRDYAGWHIHTRACAKRPVSPPGLADAPAYRRYYRGPLCVYRCRLVGPVKTCQQICR